MKYLILLLIFLTIQKNIYSQKNIDLSALRILSHAEFKSLGESDLKRVNKRPYVLKFKHSSGGELLYFGSQHIYEPNHQMLNEIESKLSTFKPDLVYWEGGNPERKSGLPKDINEAVKDKGEAGFVRLLANKRNIEDRTLEPSPLIVIEALRKTFSDTEILLHGILSQTEQARRKGKSNAELDSIVIMGIKKTNVYGFKFTPQNMFEFETAIGKILPELKDWHDLSLDMVSPKSVNDPKTNIIQKIGTISNTLRDRHMLNILLSEVGKGRKVFAVVGASHVIMQEPGLCQFFGRKYIN